VFPRADRYLQPIVTKLALVASTAGLVALVGCGGGETKGSTKTFHGGGYSFSYPAAWAAQGGETNTGRIDALVAPPEGGRNAVGLTVVRDALPRPVTQANIGLALGPAVDAFLQRSGGVLKGAPTTVMRAGLPGLRFKVSSTGLDPPVHIQATWLLDRTTAYTFNCQFLDSGAKEVMRACEQVLRSFHPE